MFYIDHGCIPCYYSILLILTEVDKKSLIMDENARIKTPMSLRACITIGVLAGSTIGGIIPTLFGSDMLSMASIFGNLIGGFIGIWAGYRVFNDYLR